MKAFLADGSLLVESASDGVDLRAIESALTERFPHNGERRAESESVVVELPDGTKMRPFRYAESGPRLVDGFGYL